MASVNARATAKSARRLSQQVIGDAAGGSNPSPALWSLVTDIPNDVSCALLSTWDVLANVLDFYTQRIGTEGSLDTAHESSSVRWLAEMGGLRARPAECARTSLALSLDDTGKEARVITLSGDGDIAVQNAPKSGEGAVVFESAQAITLDSRWNQMALQVASPASQPKLAHGALGLAFGTGTSEWRKGDGLMLSLNSESDGSIREEFVVVSSIEKLSLTTETLVSWADPLALMEGVPPKPSTASFTVEKVEHFGRPSALFGNSAAAWNTLPAKEQSARGCVAGGLLQLNDKASGCWQNAALGLPRGDATCVLVVGAGEILLGTAKGLYRRAPEGEWEKARLPAGEHEITTLSDHEEIITTTTTPTPAPPSSITVEDDDKVDGGIFGAVGKAVGTAVLGAAGGIIGGVIGGLFGGKKTVAVATPAPTPTPPPISTTTTSSKRNDTGLIYAGTKAGDVLVSSDRGASWSKITSAKHIPGTPINALIAALDKTNDRRFLLVGTAQGLKVYDFVTGKWTAPKKGIGPSGAVNAMTYFSDTLVLASEYGVFLISGVPGRGSSSDTVSELTMPCTSLVVSDDESSLFVGTKNGVWVTSDLKNWDEFNAGFPASEKTVHAFCIDDQIICTANDDGVWQSPINKANWEPFCDQVVPLFETPQGFASDMHSKIQIGPKLSRSFFLAGFSMPADTSVKAAPLPEGALAAWTSSNGDDRYLIVERSGKVVVGTIVQMPFVNDLAPFQSNVLAASRESPALNKEWPHFAIRADVVTLEKRASDVTSGTSLLVQGGGLEGSLRVTVKKAVTLLQKAFGKSANAAQLTLVEAEDDLALASRRGAQAFPSIGEVTPLSPKKALAPLSGHRLSLKASPPPLGSERKVLLQGPRRALVVIKPFPGSVTALGSKFEKQSQVSPAQITAELDNAAIGTHAKSALKSMGVDAANNMRVDVIAPSKSWALREKTRKNDRAWQILVLEGLVFLAPLTLFECLSLHADGSPNKIRSNQGKTEHFSSKNAFVWQDPAHWQADAQEYAEVKSHKSQELVLGHALKTPFDPENCQVNANCVAAIAHQSVPIELLGTSGTSGTPQSTYTLAHGPLAYDISGEGAQPLIDVYVDPPAVALNTQDAKLLKQGSRWTPVRSVACASSQARVFEVEATGKGFTQLRFGDGDYGARLPSGDAHIAASFKIGGGERGNVSAGALMALRRKPLGITRATNPFQAVGGRDCEGMEELRRRAQRVRCVDDQIVTLEDYAALAQRFERVSRAKATFFKGSRLAKPTIGLSIVWRDSPDHDEIRDRIKEMRSAIRANRVDHFEFEVETSRLLPVLLRMDVTALPTANPARLQEAVVNALFDSFGKGAWPIGADLPKQAVEHCIAAVYGVKGATIDHFAGPNKSSKAILDAINVTPISFDQAGEFDPGTIAGFLSKDAVTVTVT